MSFKLYTYDNNNRAWKALIAAQYSGINIETPKFTFGVDNKTDAFKAKNPLGKVPVLETPSGTIFESNAIARYVARLRADTNLLGDNNFQQGQVDQWIDFATNELEAARNIWVYPIQGFMPHNEKATAEAKKEVQTILGVLNQHLLHNTFLVGNHVTLADIIMVTNLVDLYAQFEPAYIAPFGNVTRWYNTCINQPQFAKVLGKSAVTAKTAAPAEKKEAAKPAAAAKPAPKADEGGDEDEDAPKKKPKSELDSLPESKMVLDTIKKLCFSERPMKKSFFEELWPQYDDAGYSWWISNYKYNDENQVLYMTGNLLGGFIQRSDAVRKYAMSAMIITGNKDEETPPFKVKGAWLFRGTGIPKEMTVENPDSEYYDWVKVDIKSEADKAKLKSIFLDETVDGESVLERRFFK